MEALFGIPIVGLLVGGLALLVVVGLVLVSRKPALPPPDESDALPPSGETEALPPSEPPKAVAAPVATEDRGAEAPEVPEDTPGPATDLPDIVVEPEVAEKAPEPPKTPQPSKESLFQRLRAGLAKTQANLIDRIDTVLHGKKKIDDELFEDLEEVLITADIGIKTVTRLLDGVRDELDRESLDDPQLIRGKIKEHMAKILHRDDTKLVSPSSLPLVIMVVGVNGAGKTTTIGKLATLFTREGKSVVLAAGDTFRAAAIEQLEVWGERAGVPVIKKDPGSDPSSVIYDALEYAKAEGADVVIADTAGRLHTQVNLMEELKKIHRVIGKVVPGAPHESLLVLDATTGQNAVMQARHFNDGVSLSGVVLTKLDGTARGGVVLGVVDELNLPVKFIGIGEQIDDLRPFDAQDFIDALF